MSVTAGQFLHSTTAISTLPVKLDYITEHYLAGQILLFIYWGNVSEVLSKNFIKYWASSGILTVETCNCDVEASKADIEVQNVENIVVFLGDIVPDQKEIGEMMKCKNWNGSRKIIIIAQGNDPKIVEIVLGRIWQYTKAINVAVMLIMTSSVQFYTSYPYQNSDIEEIDVGNLIPNKIPKNFNGSILNVGTAPAEPYVLEPAIPNQYNDGIEILILKAITDKYKININYLAPPPGESIWVVYNKNKKISGYFGMLHRHEADVVFHGVQIRPDRYSVADIILVHTFDELVWIVPIHSFIFDWKSLFVIFNTELWCLILIFLIMTSLVVYYLTNLNNFTFMDAIFQVIAQILNNAINYRRNNDLYRIFMLIFSFYTLIIISSYQTTLITFLTTPRSGMQYKTVREAVNDGLIAYMFESGKKGFNQSDHDMWNVILSPNRHVWSDDYPYMIKLVAINKTSFTLQRKNVAEFEIYKHFLDVNNEPMVYVLPEKFASYWIGMFIPHGHPLTDFFKMNTLKLFQSGIFGFWEENLKRKNRHKRNKVDEGDKGQVMLSLVHLKGAFIIFLGGLVLACIVFGAEIFFSKRLHVRMVAKIGNIGRADLTL